MAAGRESKVGKFFKKVDLFGINFYSHKIFKEEEWN